MEKQVPMDRLICGDVGYGKTEIAVRAAFKAIQDGKQVAVLVPTTLLVSQHQQTFAERYAQFPVKVASLSRFQSDKEAKEVMAGMADGTHRPRHRHAPAARQGRRGSRTSGLVIIDEEQRFGVEHKELLKTMRTAVDVLSMSATPIPRTLEMAVTGIREMSTLATPPEERHPVLTFVGAYDEKQITAAVRRELLREGQVFFVHNKVSSIERAAAACASSSPRRASPRRTARWASTSSSRSSRTSGRSASTSSSARRSSRPASTSPTPTPSSSSAPTCSASPSCTSCAVASAVDASGPTPTSSTRPRSR